MAKTIQCVPTGLQTPEGAKRANDAMLDFNQATADAANYFTQLWDEGAIHAGLDPEEMAEAERIIKLRDAAQEELLRAVAGLPSAPEGKQ